MKKQWYRLDNAALIFPAIIRKNWNNVFRVSATLKEPVDPEVLDRAIEELRPRFPTCFVRLRTGFFWYYLETITKAPKGVTQSQPAVMATRPASAALRVMETSGLP